jgi:MoaA/NifB/PqqE/SkfB family radical SAM enzyme
MQTAGILRAWKSILAGRAPSLSIEITRECPLRCPGCYAYGADHLGGDETLRDLTDYKGQALVDGILAIADRMKPLHISLVGGDPLVRYRELEQVVPQLISRGSHVQVVTSAFRVLPESWKHVQRGLTVAVSIDGLAPEHDERRKPATYDRILKNIAGHRITVHCTVTSQMSTRAGYLEEFVRFWSNRPEVEKIWFSLFTPQRGEQLPEILTPSQRRLVVEELGELRSRYPKAELPAALLKQFLKPPSSPSDCIFARTTETISADLKTRITPCQFGGDPDCSQCGCYASMALGAVGAYKVGGLISAGALFRMSATIGDWVRQAGSEPDRAPAAGLVTITSSASVPLSSAANPGHPGSE